MSRLAPPASTLDTRDAKLRALAEAFRAARYVLISAGAGWSAESGLATYRGSEFYAQTVDGEEEKMDYRDVCQPRWATDTEGGRERVFKPFWSRCAEAYRAATPHEGHETLLRLLDTKDYFVYTSNVDSHFLRTGFPRERVCEIHGSVEDAQCCAPKACPGGQGADAVFPVGDARVFVDACVHCGGAARPHVVMFGDELCIKTEHMADAYQTWVDGLTADPHGGQLLVLEFGCGRVVPSVRDEDEWVLKDFVEQHGDGAAVMFRVNASAGDAQVDNAALADAVVPMHMPALEVLKYLDDAMQM